MKRLIIVMAMACIASFTYSQSCVGPLSVTIEGSTEGTPLTGTGTETDSECNNGSGPLSGSITLDIEGGSLPYQFAWDNGATTQDLTELGAGTYAVTVTDDQGCSMEFSFEIEEPDPVEVSGIETELACNSLSGAPDGAIDLTVTGGTGAYTYAWSNGASTQDVSNLTAGTYTIDISDANGCLFQATYTLSQPDAVVASGDITEPGCNAASGAPTGAIDLSVIGGTGAYNFAWSNGATTEDVTGLAEGTYTVVVTDANGCTDEQTFTLTEPDAVTCSLDSPAPGACGENILCNGGTGTINVTAQGGTPGYEYSLDGVNFQSDATFTVPAGTHTVTVRDSNGCTSTCDITLTEPDAIIAGTCVQNDECQVDAGEIQVQASGGCAPYVITWTGSNGATLDQPSLTIDNAGGTVTFTGATGGETYTFTLTDANGCIIGG